MKQPIAIDSWYRADQYQLFSRFDQPFFGVTVRVDCTRTYLAAKTQQRSFFLAYLYRALRAANAIEAFRYRIVDGTLYLYDRVHASPTIRRPDNSFGFAYMDYYEDEAVFVEHAQAEIARVQHSRGLLPSETGANVIHCSALPWLDFSSMSHAQNTQLPDSCPKLVFGKCTEHNGRYTMPVAIHGHHALMDGYHVALFVAEFQRQLAA